MLRNLIVRLVYFVRKRKIDFDPRVPNGYLLRLASGKAVELARGLIKTRRLVAVGRGVRLRAASKLQLGRGVTIGDYSMLDALGIDGIRIGDASSIGRHCHLAVSGSLTNLGLGITIGKNVGIGDGSFIGGAGGISIGDDVITGQWVSFHPENHNFEDLETPIRLQGVNRKGIAVGKGCWLGAKVTVLDGARIGEGCVIAAGAVVRGEIPAYSIAAGVPAKVIGVRKGAEGQSGRTPHSDPRQCIATDDHG